MADRIIETTAEEVPEIPDTLEKVLMFSLEEAKEKMAQGADVVPFTALVVRENLFIESHPGESAEECFAFARHTVEGARGAEAYALCYDGYVEIDDGTRDALIAEGGVPGEDEGYAVGYVYTLDDEGRPTFEGEPAYIGEAPNFMADLKDATLDRVLRLTRSTSTTTTSISAEKPRAKKKPNRKSAARLRARGMHAQAGGFAEVCAGFLPANLRHSGERTSPVYRTYAARVPAFRRPRGGVFVVSAKQSRRTWDANAPPRRSARAIPLPYARCLVAVPAAPACRIRADCRAHPRRSNAEAPLFALSSVAGFPPIECCASAACMRLPCRPLAVHWPCFCRMALV